MDDVETFLIKKLENALSNVEHSVVSDCLCKEFNHLRKNKEINPIPPKDELYFLNNVVAEYQMELKKRKYCGAPLAIRMAIKVQRSLKKIKDKTLAQNTNSPTPDRTSRDGPVDPKIDGGKFVENRRWIPHSVDKTKIYGIDNVLMVVKRLLVGKERKVGFEAIPIVGVTGVGKTTCCQDAFNNQEVRKYFAPRIWVDLSKQSMEDKDYKKEVVKNILMCLGYEDKIIDQIGGKWSDGLRRLLLALRLQLKGKRYLIVLDGDWNSDERLADFCSSLTNDDNQKDQLANGLPKGDGGKVIIMSRSKRLAADMVGDKKLHGLVPLADDETCWKVFLDTVGKALTEDMKKLKVEIVKNCAGLPLVAKMLGEIEFQRISQNHS